MAGLSFLAKKSWHTSNLSNQEKVWLAEQKAAAEATKVKELQTQIALEREKEEFEKLAGRKSKGDRGVNWMYEEGGGPAYDGQNAELEAAKEEEQNEAYLLGKEYVPKGQDAHVGDFAVAAAMGGVLEKASTRGAVIGVGESVSEAAAGVRLKDDNEEVKPDDDGRSEFNREFHLRHEDPMFAVHQKRERQRKEVEKKRNLMERAGLVVKEVKRGDSRDEKTRDHDDVDNERKRSRKDRSRKRKKHHKHRHRRDRSSSPSSSSSSSSDRRHKKRKKHHRHHSHRRDRRDRSTSRDRSEFEGYEDSSRRKDKHHDKQKDIDDGRDHDSHYNERKRDRSKHVDRSERRYRGSTGEEFGHRRDDNRYCHDGDDLDEFGRKRHTSGSRHGEDRDETRGRHGRPENNGTENSRGRRDLSPERGHQHQREEKNSDNTSSKQENRRQDQSPKKEGYGLIGTSLSDRNPTTSSGAKQSTSLGPNEDLLAAKRREAEKDRHAKLDQSRRRWDRDGRSEEDRKRALEEMEKNARNR